MSASFSPHQGLIVVEVYVVGPLGPARLRLALDTGATNTTVNLALLVAIGYDPALASHHARVVTASGVELAPQITVTEITALGKRRTDFSVLGLTLPPTATIDGLLGLDFFRGTVLQVDFQQGHITLT